MPDGSTASYDDIAPNESPVLALTGLMPGIAVTFSVSGSVNNSPGPSGLSPDGGGFASRNPGAENGISDITAPMNSLLGVFLDNNQPDSSSAPSALNFQTLGLDFSSLSPVLKQVFLSATV